ncbi:MAG: methylated-DNA--[protein]-cysteine S-methyltransferase [Actinomycetota bacterium]
MSTTIDAQTFDTPAGPLSVLVDPADGHVVAAGFASATAIWERLPAGSPDLRSDADLGPVAELIEAYLGGDLAALDRIPVRQPGTALQQEVWDGLRAIPAGETRTYTQLAATTTKPKAVRAAGTACGRNLIAPMVPCHRALRTDGTLGGYYYGLEVKQWLLAHEGAASSPSSTN